MTVAANYEQVVQMKAQVAGERDNVTHRRADIPHTGCLSTLRDRTYARQQVDFRSVDFSKLLRRLGFLEIR